MAEPYPTTALNRIDALIAFLLLAAAALLRIPGLEQLPPALWFDEGLNGVDALAIARGGAWPLVFTEVFPREPALIYPMALLIRLFGPETFSLRLAAALVGIMAPALLYLWLRKAFDNANALLTGRQAALLAAIFLVGFRWHLHFSRIALRTIWTPTLACAVYAALWMAFSSRRKRWAGISGALLGFGAYTYLSWYFFAPGALFVAASGFWRQRRENLAWKSHLAIFCLAGALVACPMWVHYLASPGDATGRAAELSLFKDGLQPALKNIVKNARDSALMLVWKGDHVPKHNIPWKPALEPIGGLLFLIGLWGVAASLRRSLLSRALVLWLVLGTLPTIVSDTDSANFLRTLVITPAVAAVVGIGASQLSGLLHRARATQRLGKVLPTLLVLCSVALMLVMYFITWARWPGLKANFSGEADDIARYVRTIPPETTVYVPSALAQDSYTFRFLTAEQDNVIAYAQALPQPVRSPAIVIESPMINATTYEEVVRNPGYAGVVRTFLAPSAEGDFPWARAMRIDR